MNTSHIKDMIHLSVEHIKSHYNHSDTFYQDKNFKEPLINIGNSLATISDPCEFKSSINYFKDLLGKEVPEFLVPSTHFLLPQVLFQIATNFIEISDIDSFKRDIVIESLSDVNHIKHNIVSTRKKYRETTDSLHLAIK